MQEQRFDGAYLDPVPLAEALKDLKDAPQPEVLEQAVGRLLDGSAKRILLFAGTDEEGHPTPELRRAWRRRNRSKGHRRE